MIQKWQGMLERDYNIHQGTSTYLSMENSLGQFLRFMHYQMIYIIQSEAKNVQGD